MAALREFEQYARIKCGFPLNPLFFDHKFFFNVTFFLLFLVRRRLMDLAVYAC